MRVLPCARGAPEPPPTLNWMRIPSGDLVPARKHRFSSGYGRHRRRRPGRTAVVGMVLLALGLGGFWLTRDPVRPVAAPCTPASASPSPARLIPGPGRVRVEVLNGTARVGLVQAVALQLRARGFVVVREDNAPAARPGPSLVAYPAGGRDAAEVLARYVLGAQVADQPTAGSAASAPSAAGATPSVTVQLVLGSGFRRLATPAEVAARASTAAAAAAATPVATPPGTGSTARPCP